jgi:hypothetical protein
MDVITLIVVKKKRSSGPFANSGEERDELTELTFVEVAELLVMGLVDAVIHLIEEPQSRLCNPRRHESPIVSASLPRDQSRVLEPIQQPGHVRHLTNQSGANLVAAEPIGLGSPQNPEDVVLGTRDPVLLERALERVLEQGGRPLNAEMGLFLEAPERLVLFQLSLKIRGHDPY